MNAFVLLRTVSRKTWPFSLWLRSVVPVPAFIACLCFLSGCSNTLSRFSPFSKHSAVVDSAPNPASLPQIHGQESKAELGLPTEANNPGTQASNTKDTGQSSSPESASALGEDNAGKAAPVAVSVAQAFYVGDMLQVKVRLESRKTLPSNQVLVSVLGLNDGQLVEKHSQSVGALIQEEEFKKNRSTLLTFRLNSTKLTEYQVLCRWGKDALQANESLEPPVEESPDSDRPPATQADARALAPTGAVATPADAAADAKTLEEPEIVRPEKNSKETSKSKISESELQKASSEGNRDEARQASEQLPAGEVLPPTPTSEEKPLALEGIALEETQSQCDSPPCDLHYALNARVLNHSSQEIQGVKLAVGLVWSNAQTLPRPLPNYAPAIEGEELIDLKQLRLMPGASKKLRVKIDRPVPVVPGGRFYPYIRLIQAGSNL